MQLSLSSVCVFGQGLLSPANTWFAICKQKPFPPSIGHILFCVCSLTCYREKEEASMWILSSTTNVGTHKMEERLFSPKYYSAQPGNSDNGNLYSCFCLYFHTSQDVSLNLQDLLQVWNKVINNNANICWISNTRDAQLHIHVYVRVVVTQTASFHGQTALRQSFQLCATPWHELAYCPLGVADWCAQILFTCIERYDNTSPPPLRVVFNTPQ